VDEDFRARSLTQNRFLFTPLKFLPDPFRLLKLFFPLVMQQFPADGWDFTSIENCEEKFAFSTMRCFHLDTLTTHGAPELTALFCKTDDVMAELFPPSIEFVRPHTLGRGDALCDFQYCRIRKPGKQVVGEGS